MNDISGFEPMAQVVRPSQTTVVERNGDGTAMDPARRTAEQFEAFFLSRMLDQISSETPTDGPFGGGHAEKVYRGMLNEQYGTTVARSGGMGIADSIYRQILAMQEGNV